MGTLVAVAQDDDADEEFWNQDFFKEEEQDIRYETESEPEDDADADFSESEEEIDSDEEAAEAEADAQARDKKKKVLRPPGYKPPPVPGAAIKPKPKPKNVPTSAEKKQQKQVEVKKEKIDTIIDDDDDGIIIPVERTVMVRESTRQKVLEGEEERRVMEAVKPRRTSKPTVVRQLTQQELLSEAAYTEIENLKSLELLKAAEEATKKKANMKKARYAGPMLRVVSRKDRTTQEERTTLEVRNMAVPPELVPRGPPGGGPVPRAVCAISGLPAKYKDPLTKMPYANVEAFKELRSRAEKGLIYVK
jgi:vacuolar protein sorting-associated protein 72